ncbi:hypothetical protein BTW32_04550 [Bacillus thuringiensis]|nr:hypothetical protein BTW32_04550 [Bacillus thuringiensis]
MRVFFEFFLLMCCFASVFLLALEIRRYIHIKKDTFLCNIQEMSRDKINIMIRSCVTGCFIVAFLILKLNIA